MVLLLIALKNWSETSKPAHYTHAISEIITKAEVRVKTEVKVTEKKLKVKNLAFVYYFGCIFAPKKCSQFNAWYVERDRGGNRENMGRKGYGRRKKKDKKGQETGFQRGREAGEQFKKESVCHLTAYDPLKNMKSLTLFDFHLTPPRL